MCNCTTCINSYTKQDSFWDNENIYICSLDNHYIGYPDEAKKRMLQKIYPNIFNDLMEEK